MGEKTRPLPTAPSAAGADLRLGAAVIGRRLRGAGWADPAIAIPLHRFAHDGLSCPGPCGINCTNNNEAFSFHPGGVSAAFADGGVRFLSENLRIETYAALITRAGNEPIAGAGL